MAISDTESKNKPLPARPLKRGQSRKLLSYSLAGAASAVGVDQNTAAVVEYDATGSPINVQGDTGTFPYNMAVINPSVGSLAGLVGQVDDSTGSFSDGANTSAPADSALPGNVFFRFTAFDDGSGNTKNGTQFGVVVGAGNGIYGTTGSLAGPNGATPTQFAAGEIIGDGDALLTTDTNSFDALSAVQVDLDGAGLLGTHDVVNGQAYLGFQLGGRNGFVLVNDNSGGNTPSESNFEILGWAYETTPGAPITAQFGLTAVPEPGAVPIFALGVGGILAHRRRRRTPSHA